MAGDPNFVVVPTADGGVARLGSRNLTNDATGLKNRTDDEIKAMFMNGLRPTATGMEPLFPIMPYYVFHNLAAADADAIVAYLRTIPAVNNEIPRRDPMFDLPGPANYLNPANIPTPALGNDAAQESALRGRYLAAESGLCIECHTQHLTGPDAGGDVLTPGMYFAGGEDFSAFFASTLMIHPVSKNLTSDGTTGLGNWTAQDIVTVLKMGRAKDGTGICPPMPAGPMGAYGGLTDGDALDIANYIKSLPAIVHDVPDMCVFPPVQPDAGPTEAGADSTSSTDTGTDGASTGDAASD
jgi:mono/diheme cytochrome c family protein